MIYSKDDYLIDVLAGNVKQPFAAMMAKVLGFNTPLVNEIETYEETKFRKEHENGSK
jgi:orotate phosphoribosyltransferase-like protein